MNPEDRLERLADSISRGDLPDPGDVDGAPEAESSVVRNLMALSRMNQYQRAAAEAAGDPAAGTDPDLPTWPPLKVLRLLGRGGQGSVFHAWDPQLQRPVALKLLHADRERAGRLLEEARLLARIRHENVAQVYGIDEVDGVTGIRMEYLDGPTLDEVAAARGSLPEAEVVAIARQLLSALTAVHEAGILHRDVKGLNVVRERPGRVVLTDFGAGIGIAGAAERDTATGTPRAMAPELFDGGAPSVSSDLYSLGVLLFRLLTGEYPVEAETVEQLVEAHAQGRRRSVADVRPQTSPELAAVVDRALAPRVADRFGSAAAMAAALGSPDDVAQEPPAGVHRRRPGPTLAPGSAWSRLRWVGAAVAILLTAVVMSRNWPQAPSPSQTPLVETATLLRGTGPFQPVRSGDAVEAGDLVHLRLELTRAAHVYVLNQDDSGALALLFPLPGYALVNPLSAGEPLEIPGAPAAGGLSVAWTIGANGGRERFLILASVEPMAEFDSAIAALPTPGEIPARPLADDTVASLYRGVTGLAELPAEVPTSDGSVFDLARRLTETEGDAGRVWLREIVLRND